ncbi:hypothetical protein CT676_33805 [Bradyrhizobium sp. MOS001]|uniref:hypothetical protein n=1 Tax=Bradyrhizobium sp. MOS001 TaxID=2133948 RepID=UPI00107547A0|nr:hypothetical protein [Bradyrhizobium sp. MOS001]TFW56669.1 hypothetical protein CT676_33805 [Bradyrhizobium sp. MOS001]
MRSSPSIVPADRLDRDIYLVLEDFGAHASRVGLETDIYQSSHVALTGAWNISRSLLSSLKRLLGHSR